MNPADPVLVHFATVHPSDVADILNASPPDEITEFVQTLSPAVAAPVIADLSSRQLSFCIQHLPASFIAEVVLAAGHADKMTIVSHLPESAYKQIVDATTGQSGKELSRLLKAPGHTLGSLATPDFIRVSETATCGAIKQELEAREDGRPLPLFVMDANARFQGIVSSMSVLAAANAERQIGEFADRVEPLPGRLSVNAATNPALWRHHSILAVVDLEGHLLGAVTYDQVVQADTRIDTETFDLEDVIQVMAQSYIEVSADILDLVLGKRQI